MRNQFFQMEKTDAVPTWSNPPATLNLQPGQVDIWRIALDLPPATVKSLDSVLSADERERAARFRFPGGTERYTVAHGCLRHILARYLDCDPKQLCFSTNEYGKPALQGYNLEFNLSHSGERALVAVSLARRVGVDVEHIRPDLELIKTADRFFSQNEVTELMALPPHQHQIAFFNCWSRKEAYIKALGLGLSLPLDSFDVSLADPAILRATRPDEAEAARWRLLSLEVEPGYTAAVAVEGQGLEFRFWDY
jgi:4'-phosphopantetheinyl transferase